MRPLHIAVDANVLEAAWGGIPKHVSRIAERLAAGGDRVDLLVNLRHWRSPVAGARAVPLRLKGREAWRQLRVPAWTLRHRPDVLWAPEGLLPRYAPVPTVVTVHDLAPVLLPGSKPPAVERAFRTAMPRSAGAATLVACVSRVTGGDVQRLWGVPEERIRIVPNGVDATFAPGDGGAVARRHGIEGPYVLHVGALEPRKGLDPLIAAAGGADWRLVLAGTPAFDGERIERAARAAGAVLLRGASDDELADLYRGAHAVALPSLYEGFGIVALEAMACGAPVAVAAQAGALEEVVGDAAVLVRERTPEAWRTAVAEASARRGELAARGRERASGYGWDEAAAAMREVLWEAAGA